MSAYGHAQNASEVKSPIHSPAQESEGMLLESFSNL